MPLYKFGPNDVYYNTIEVYPSCSFFVYDGQTFYNNQTSISGAFVDGRAGIARTWWEVLETCEGVREGECSVYCDDDKHNAACRTEAA